MYTTHFRVQPYTISYVCGEAEAYVLLYYIRFSVIGYISLTRI